jgi:TonB family protein
MKMRSSQITSILLHAGAVFALLHLSAVQELPENRKQPELHWTSIKLEWHLPPGDAKGGGSGNGVLPASKGELPRTAPRQFLPPTTKRPETMPSLPVEPVILGAPDPARKPELLSLLGDPTARTGPPSDGNQGGTGIGQSPMGRGGVGNNRGPSFGDGNGGIVPGGSMGGITTQPKVIYMIEPEFTEEARKARLQGTVVLSVEIDERGQVHNIRVLSPLGLGLEEKAIEAVRKWRFHPATRNGKPVRVPALVEVNFHLL